METITILANALVTASKLDIIRLDIQYNKETELYKGILWLGKGETLSVRYKFDISEDGSITKCRL